MNKPRGNKVEKLKAMRSAGNKKAVDPRFDNINCPYSSECDRISRGQFLKIAGVGAAAIGAAAVGLGTVAKAQAAPPPPPPVWYIKEDRDTKGNWFIDKPGDFYGDCAWILGAMCAPLGIENQVPHDGDYHYFDLFGGLLMGPDCGLDYKVYTCKPSGSCDKKALESFDETQRRAACWFNNGNKTITLNIPGTDCYQVSLYLIDYDSTTRTENITVIDSLGSSGPISVSNFSTGKYLKFQVNPGTVTISIEHTGGANAVISGIFLDKIVSCPSAATYIGEDTTTQGNWVGTYGNDWYLLCSWNNPSDIYKDTSITYNDGEMGHYAWSDYCNVGQVCNIIEPTKEKNFSFAWGWGSDATGKGLKVPPGYSCPEDCGNCPEILGAASWASCYDDGGEGSPGLGPDLYVDLTLPEAGGCSSTSCYQVSFYATDYDSNCRAQVIEIHNPLTGALLADSSAAPGGPTIGAGVYHTFFMPAGNYLVKIRRTGCTNAILSGIFVDCVECPKGTGDMRTIGYWKHQFAVACGKNKGKAQVPPATLTAYMNAIAGKSSIFKGLTMCGTNPLTSAYKILWPSEPATMCTRARQQLFALWLNWAAGAVNWNQMVYDVVNGEYVQFNLLMPQLESAIPGDCSWPHSTADWLNNSGYE